MTKVIIITGPTGVGKTKLSIEIAKRLHTEIINGDAYQVYQDMNILTAKIKENEKENIPHHLFDIKMPTEEYSVAEYQQNVRNLIDDFTTRKLVPLIVGGSGLYIDSIIYDYNFSSNARSNKTEEVYANLSNEKLHQVLQSLNLEASVKIHHNNRKRVLRAIELAKNDAVINTFNNTLVYDPLIIFLNEPREELYSNLNKRVDLMVEEGLIEEVSNLQKKNLSKTASLAIGYKELIPYFEDNKNLSDCLEEVKKNTRHLAKRQITWFKRHQNINIIEIDRLNFDNTIEKVYSLITEFLKNN